MTREEILTQLEPDFALGHLYWKVARSNRVRVGDRAGTISNRYWVIRLGSKIYFQHRVLWFLYHGAWPEKEIDHIDRNSLNNSITKLRVVSRQENMHNIDARSNTGVKGVHFDKRQGKFVAKLKVGYKSRHLGTFNTPVS